MNEIENDLNDWETVQDDWEVVDYEMHKKEKEMKELTKQKQARGIETLEPHDLILPRVLLMQPASKFVQKNGAHAGTFVNSLTKLEIPTKEFVPVVLAKYWDLYRPDKEDPDAMVFDKRVFELPEGRKLFNDEDGKADTVPVLSFISLFGGMPMVLGFSKSSYKGGKKLCTLASASQKDLFSGKYVLTTQQESAKINGRIIEWYQADIEYIGDSSPEEYIIAEKLYNAFGKSSKQITSAGLENDVVENVPF